MLHHTGSDVSIAGAEVGEQVDLLDVTSRFIKEVDLLQEVKEVCKETTLATYRKKKAGGHIVR